jgi:N-acetylglucosaminyldiphosphoundecaprenol N-acetyl-beta-D-mannosaminyltransferase
MIQSSFIFNTRIDNIAKQDIFLTVEGFLESNLFHQIATVNPEFLLLSLKDTRFRNILNKCELNVADGVGIHFAFWRQRKKLQTRMAGADLMAYILQQAERKNLSVMCVVRKDGLSKWKDIRRALKKQYPKLRVEGIDISITRHPELVLGSRTLLDDIESKLFERIKKSHIILCNFGAPYQEVFLADFRKNTNAIRVAMGVGGSFDFLTGKTKRAPRLMRALGLEWLWRLFLQPRRFKRIWNAVIVFPVRVLFVSRK